MRRRSRSASLAEGLSTALKVARRRRQKKKKKKRLAGGRGRPTGCFFLPRQTQAKAKAKAKGKGKGKSEKQPPTDKDGGSGLPAVPAVAVAAAAVALLPQESPRNTQRNAPRVARLSLVMAAAAAAAMIMWRVGRNQTQIPAARVDHLPSDTPVSFLLRCLLLSGVTVTNQLPG